MVEGYYTLHFLGKDAGIKVSDGGSHRVTEDGELVKVEVLSYPLYAKSPRAVLVWYAYAHIVQQEGKSTSENMDHVSDYCFPYLAEGEWRVRDQVGR